MPPELKRINYVSQIEQGKDWEIDGQKVPSWMVTAQLPGYPHAAVFEVVGDLLGLEIGSNVLVTVELHPEGYP